MSDDARRLAGASVRDSDDEQERSRAVDAVQQLIVAHDRDHTLSEPMPAAVSERVEETLSYLARNHDHQSSPPAFETAAQSHSRRRPVLLAAAAAVVAVAVGVPVVWNLASDSTPAEITAGSDDTTTTDSTEGVDPADPALIATMLGRSAEGRLAQQADREMCLAANGVAADTPILGSGRITVDSTEGTLFVLPGSEPTTMIALVVGDECGADNPDLITRTVVG